MHAQEPAIAVGLQRDEAEEIVVHAELPLLGLGGLLERIEGR